MENHRLFSLSNQKKRNSKQKKIVADNDRSLERDIYKKIFKNPVYTFITHECEIFHHFFFVGWVEGYRILQSKIKESCFVKMFPKKRLFTNLKIIKFSKIN